MSENQPPVILQLENPIAPLQQREGESPKFEENPLHGKFTLWSPPQAAGNALAEHFQLPCGQKRWMNEAPLSAISIPRYRQPNTEGLDLGDNTYGTTENPFQTEFRKT